MGTHGPISGATFAEDASVGTISLSNPTNAQVSDDSRVTWVLLLGQLGRYLKATNFGFTIPLDATILGIQVEIEQSATVSVSMIDNSVKLVKGGTIGGTDKGTGTSWPTSDAYASYGSASDLWGQTWTPADINASNFGVAISPNCQIAATAQIDHVRITVTYQGSNRPGELGQRLRVTDGVSCVERVS